MNHYAATNPAYDVSPVNDPQLIITTPIENESSSHRHGTDLPPHSKGTPITGCGELGPFSTSSPRSAQTPATTTIGHISGVNDTAEAPKLASSVDQSSPAVPSLHAQDDGQESDFRGRLKSAGDGSLSGEVEQPLDSANQEEEKLPFKGYVKINVMIGMSERSSHYQECHIHLQNLVPAIKDTSD